MKNILYIALSLAIIVSSCKRSDDTHPGTPESILENLQTINYIPRHHDGKAQVVQDENSGGYVTVLDFQFYPNYIAESIVESWEELFSLQAVQTISRAINMIDISIISCSAEATTGIVSITASASTLPEDFFTGNATYNAALVISDQIKTVTSSYIPLTIILQEPEPEPEPVNEIINIPDTAFKSYLLALYDTDGDGEIRTLEAEVITNISCSGRKITKLTGIEHFANLQSLDCSNNQISSLDLSKNDVLTTLNCSTNNIAILNLHKNIALKNLSCCGNKITDLSLVNNTALKSIMCYDNPNLINLILWDSFDFSNIDLSVNNGLKIINAAGNSLLKVGSIITVNKGKGIVYEAGSTPRLISCTEMSGPWSDGINWSANYGTSGWVLPQKDDLLAAYKQIKTINSVLTTKGFAACAGQYWSYTVYNKYDAYGVNLTDGTEFFCKVTYTFNVRSVTTM